MSTTSTTTNTKKSRARKTSALPTRVYAYGCSPPITESARVEDQFRLAAQYKNALVEIEHRLRDRFRDIQIADPDVGPALQIYEGANGAIDAAYDDLRAAKSGTADPDLAEPRAFLTVSKELRAWAAAELSTAKTTAKDRLVPLYEQARELAAHERLLARQDYSARGLRHGAYDAVEKAVQQAAASTKRPLHFERYDGSGKIGTQLTEKGGDRGEAAGVRGLTMRELTSAADTRLRLGPPGALDRRPHPLLVGITSWDEVWRLPRAGLKHAARTWVDLRVGSNPDRSPIFARMPVVFHRVPSKDAVIKWAYVTRRRVGPNLVSEFQITLESPTFERPPVAIGEGACAVNLGWRRVLDDEGNVVALRAGYVVDEAGHEREILVPDYTTSSGGGKKRRRISVFAAVGKLDDLAKIRDQNLERVQHALSVWIADRGGMPAQWQIAAPRSDGSVGAPLADRLRGYSSWRSHGKLRAFVAAWETARVPGDDPIFATLRAWSAEDRHLEEWATNQRVHMQAQRREAWRLVAVDLARTYATILVGKSKLPEIDGWEQKEPDEGDPSEGREQRRMSRIAAPGELRAEIEKAAHKTGASVIRCNETGATQRCHACGCEEPWDAAPAIEHTCPGCGRTWDQDANYCKNLLIDGGYANGGDPIDPAGALAPPIQAKHQGTAGSAAAVMMRSTKP